MARLLINNTWYDSVSSAAYWEIEYEKVLLQYAETLYPDYWLVPFKTAIRSETAIAKPDFALIEKQYRLWWVVEVELAHHSLHAHVLPQVQTLANGVYGEAEANYLLAQSDRLQSPALRGMMKGAQPRVLVIVNGPVSRWAEELDKHHALLAIIEVFRSDRNHHVFRVNGAYPSRPADVVSTCRLDPSLRRMLIVDSPANLEIPEKKRLLIEFDGAVTEWERLEGKNRVWLNPVRNCPLPLNARVVLIRDTSGRLVFRLED